MKRVLIGVPSGSCTVQIEPGLLRRAGREWSKLFGGEKRRCFVLTVPPVRKHWGRVLGKALRQGRVAHEFLEMPDGERAKSLASVEKLARQLVRLGADRSSVILSLGGGVAGDVAGFLASVYMRGVQVVQVPTTFLAQVDAAIGGKTGVNLPEGKNLVGTFHQPRAVWIDPAVLSTLPQRDYRAGLFEALKCGVIRNPQIFSFLERQRARVLRREAKALEWLIAECVRVKAKIVRVDEREHGLRRILNFGHTIGHALEAEAGFRRFRHGEGVGWGMVAAALVAADLGICSAGTAQRITEAVLAYGPLPEVRSGSTALMRRVPADKKTVGGVTHFILPTAIGRVRVVPGVPEATVRRAVDRVRQLSRIPAKRAARGMAM